MGIVTLTTDFGMGDPFVAVMKGQILRRSPGTTLVDVTHDIAPFRPDEAGFWLARIAQYFPDGTVHLAVVDPGVGTRRALLGLEWNRQIYLAPDNGLLAEVAARPGAAARRIADATFAAIGAEASGATFHGRDLLAPLAAELACGRLPFAALGPNCEPQRSPGLPAAQIEPAGIRGAVATVDHFGNLITNIEAARFEPGRGWHAELGGRAIPRVAAYADAPEGDLVSLVNGWGLVEVAEVAGNAALRLAVTRGEPVFLRYGPGG